jgi:AhpD family alkylhydroperoxidase
MKARMTNPVMVLPDAMKALLALSKAAQSGTVPQTTHTLIHLRVSQINGCGVCVDMHSRELKHAGEKDERIWGVGAWRESPYYSDAERAALALAESVTRLADRPDVVRDEAADHYDEKELSSLLVSIAAINVWNRLNAATRQPAGSAW